jgi:hypothetical protein
MSYRGLPRAVQGCGSSKTSSAIRALIDRSSVDSTFFRIAEETQVIGDGGGSGGPVTRAVQGIGADSAEDVVFVGQPGRGAAHFQWSIAYETVGRPAGKRGPTYAEASPFLLQQERFALDPDGREVETAVVAVHALPRTSYLADNGDDDGPPGPAGPAGLAAGPARLTSRGTLTLALDPEYHQRVRLLWTLRPGDWNTEAPSAGGWRLPGSDASDVWPGIVAPVLASYTTTTR